MAEQEKMNVAEGFEVFSDPAYYDMWCLRPIGSTDFNQTMHFAKYNDAAYASHVVVAWIGKLTPPKPE